MPFIVTTKRPCTWAVHEPEPDCPLCFVSHQAVATLEEANQIARRRTDLADGTDVDVSQVAIEDVFSMLPHLTRAALSMQGRDTDLGPVLVAYNAREAQHGH